MIVNRPEHSRRSFFHATAVGVGSLAMSLAGCRQPAPDGGETDVSALERGFIDAHVHVWTPDVQRYPLAPGFTRKGMRPSSFTPAELMALMGPTGVTRVVLIQMSYYRFDNSYMLDTMERHPGVFSGVAVIDANGKDPAAEMRRLKARGIRGFRIVPRERGNSDWLESDGMRAMWACGAAEGLAMCTLIDAEDLPAVDRMCQSYPRTPVVVDHFARIGHDGHFHDKELGVLCNLARLDSTHVKLSAFYYLGKKSPPYTDLAPLIRPLLNAFGRERLMWATDAPFQVSPPHTYAASVELIRDRLDFLDADDREWILRRTAERVFFS